MNAGYCYNFIFLAYTNVCSVAVLARWVHRLHLIWSTISLGFNRADTNYSAQNGSESRFRVKCFFLGSISVTYYGLFYCTIGFVLRQCFSILFEFQFIRKGCIFFTFLPFVLLFVRSCCNSAFIFELHRCSKGRSISRVQTENCYYFRNGFCLSL